MTTATITQPTPAAKAAQLEAARQIAAAADRQWGASYSVKPATADQYPLIATASNVDWHSESAPNHLRVVAGKDGTLYVSTTQTLERNARFTALLIG